MGRRRVFIRPGLGILTGALLVGASIVVPSVAAVAATTAPIVSLTTVYSPNTPQITGNVFADLGNAQLVMASTASGLEVAGTNRLDGTVFNFQILPPFGGSLEPGQYPIRIGASGQSDPSLPSASIFYQNVGGAFSGDLDIRDLGVTATGVIQRFDVAFKATQGNGATGFSGEMRMGEPANSTLLLSAREMAWNEPPIGYPAQVETEWLHNVGSTATTVGAASIGGDAAHDFTIASNSCSGHSLAASAICAIQLGFSPTQPGPRNAKLLIGTGSALQEVALTGTGPLGTSSITTSGNDSLDQGTTHTVSAGKSSYITSFAHPTDFTWESHPAAGTDSNQMIVSMSTALGDTPLTVGVHPTVTNSDATGAQYGESTFVNGVGCGASSGSMNVKAFEQDAFGNPSLANISYTQYCIGEKAAMTAILLWHWRADRTAPVAPTAIAVNGSGTLSASWHPSASPDVAYTIARLVEGDGVGVTAGSGFPISAGSATSGVLPLLAGNERYTVAVFAVDTSGNVSPAATHTFVTGTVTPPVTLAGPPTHVMAVAGNGSATVSFAPPVDNGGSPITGYVVQTPSSPQQFTGSASPITVTGLKNGLPYVFVVSAVTAVGRGTQSPTSPSVTPKAPTSPPPTAQLLPDPGFEAGNGGWVPFGAGSLTRTSNPVHSGAAGLRVTPSSSSPAITGITQNTVVVNSVAGKKYTFSCWVRPSAPGLSVLARFLEYTQNFGSDLHLAQTTAANLSATAWTRVTVTGTAVKSGERIIPQIYSTNDAIKKGAISYDDCSVTSG